MLTSSLPQSIFTVPLLRSNLPSAPAVTKLVIRKGKLGRREHILTSLVFSGSGELASTRTLERRVWRVHCVRHCPLSVFKSLPLLRVVHLTSFLPGSRRTISLSTTHNNHSESTSSIYWGKLALLSYS